MAVTLFVFDCHLRVVMLTAAQASKLQGFLKLGFAPITNEFLISLQGAGQILCLS